MVRVMKTNETTNETARINTIRRAMDAIATAQRELFTMPSTRDVDSAKLCLDDARACYAKKDFGYAIARALESLAYSVGVFHPSYKSVAKHPWAQ